MLTEAHGWEPHSTNANTTKTTYWKLKPRLGTRSHLKGTKFYLHYKTHDRQQLRVPQLANHSLQKWYKMEELLERSPTLPQTYQTIARNDGKSSENLTVNSNLGFEAEQQSGEYFANRHSLKIQRADAKQTSCSISQTTLAKRRRGNLTKRRRTAYVILSVNSWSPKTSEWISHTTQHILAAGLTGAPLPEPVALLPELVALEPLAQLQEPISPLLL
ncbi:hypothetical protein F511_22582 [Dorcoceras hygrometricum]|uniref:Uncharacterized protein n=1 Tax=Dorcoceras hygrometricum TaxID=472368 RepID=A0A2Z7B789_9LAMI|nr:hypothetical protein F511_22582 [Dorcoceras hygrometricum]